MAKILRIGLIILLAISALVTILFYGGGEELNGDPKFTDIFLIWAAILTGLTVGVTIIFPVIQMIMNPKNAKKSLFGILALAIFIAIAYGISSSEVLGITNPDLMKYDTAGYLKFAGTLLNATYMLAAFAIISMIYTEVSKAFK